MRISLLVSFLLLFSPLFGQVEISNDGEYMELAFLENCRLVIEVETNVNEFDCNYLSRADFTDLCFQGKLDERSVDFYNAQLNLPVHEFDCGGSLINKDFRELLYTEEHPYISVEFKRATWYPLKVQEQNRRLGRPVGYFEVEIALAGHSKTKTLQIYSSHLKERTLFSRGSIDIHMTEFGIEPPEKFLGMVKVKDLLTINFDLNIKRLS